MSLNVPGDNVPRIKLPRDNVPRHNVYWDNIPRHNVPQGNCPSQQCPSQKLFLVTIAPRDKCSSIPLQMFICTEDGPLDDQNQGDVEAWTVANNYPDDLASSVLLWTFENGHLQRGRFSGRPK